MFNHNTKSPECWSHSWLGKKTKHKSEHNQERGAIALKVLFNASSLGETNNVLQIDIPNKMI